MNLERYKLGSIEQQIVSLSSDIFRLTEHLGEFKKDKHSRRGLIIKIAKRKKYLKYLKLQNNKMYKSILMFLNIKDN